MWMSTLKNIKIHIKEHYQILQFYCIHCLLMYITTSLLRWFLLRAWWWFPFTTDVCINNGLNLKLIFAIHCRQFSYLKYIPIFFYSFLVAAIFTKYHWVSHWWDWKYCRTSNQEKRSLTKSWKVKSEE